MDRSKPDLNQEQEAERSDLILNPAQRYGSRTGQAPNWPEQRRRTMGKKTIADSIEWTDEQLEEADIDRRRVIEIIRHLRKASDLMKGTGLHVYGASGCGCLIHSSRPTHTYKEKQDQGSIIAFLGEGYDGGDW